MSFTVTQAEGGKAWEQAITGLGASPLMSGRWLEAVGSARRQPIYLRITGPSGEPGTTAGLVLEPPAALLRSYGRRLFFYTGPALPVFDPQQTAEAVRAVVDFARRSGMAGVVYRSWDFPHAYEFPEVLRHRSRRKEFVLDLSADMAVVDARMRPQIHRQVRQARAAGLTFAHEERVEILDELRALMEQTRAVRLAKGYDDYEAFYLPHLNREGLTHLFRGGLARGFSVRQAGEVLSVVIVLVLGRRAVGLLIGTSAEGYRLKAPSLLWYETARHLKLDGVQSLNLLGVPSGQDGKALAFFKQSLGCEKFPCADAATGLLRHSPMFLLAKLWSGRRIGWT